MARVEGGGRRDKRDKPLRRPADAPERVEEDGGPEGEPELGPIETGNGGGVPEEPGERDQNDKPVPNKKKRPLYKRPLFLVVLAVVVIGAVIGGFAYWSYTRQFETTDDAYIDAHITTVSPRVAGIVVEIPPDVDDNRLVTAGEKLLQIDPRDFNLQIASAKAALLAAQGKLAQAQAQEKVAEANAASARADVVTADANASMAASDLKRYTALDPRAVSKQQLDSATAAAASSAAIVEADRRKAEAADAQVNFAGTQVETAKADIETAKVSLANAELQRSYTTILAPITGRLTRKDVQLGMYVQVGQALLSLVPREVFVTANFKETQLAGMHEGDRVDISVDAFPGRKFRGHVDSIQKGSGARFSLLPPENATGNFVKVVQRVPVKIDFDEGIDDLKGLGPGISVQPRVWIANH